MKPIYEKPQLYAHYFFYLKEIARDMGYNLVLHGSMNRDLDLVAIPWVDKPKNERSLIQALDKFLTGKSSDYKEHYLYKVLPGGRHSYVINLNRGGYADGVTKDGFPNYIPDPQYYLDISITPLIIK